MKLLEKKKKRLLTKTSKPIIPYKKVKLKSHIEMTVFDLNHDII